MPRNPGVRTRVRGGGGTSSTDRAVGLGHPRVGRATPKEKEAGLRAGPGNRGTGHSGRSVRKVGGPNGSQSGKPSPVLSRKSVCGRRQGVAPAMVAEEGEVAALQPPAPFS